jgi:hypothetical protein
LPSVRRCAQALQRDPQDTLALMLNAQLIAR